MAHVVDNANAEPARRASRRAPCAPARFLDLQENEMAAAEEQRQKQRQGAQGKRKGKGKAGRKDKGKGKAKGGSSGQRGATAAEEEVVAEEGHDDSGDDSGAAARPKKKRRQRQPRDPMCPLSYALRLSEYHDYGRCGVEEREDTTAALPGKIAELAEMVRTARHVVVHTGAGISTAAGIPDFRGKDGVWTKHKSGVPLPAADRCWNNALPTASHMALAALAEAGVVAAVITQNIDGLHVRSGLRPHQLAELHGNIFKEACAAGDGCGEVYTRSFDVGGVGFRETGRQCPKCGKPLVDQLLDWEDDLPDNDFAMADDQAELCVAPGGVAICLGTSMQMTPARDWPCKADKMVIVNLQPTVRDDKAALVIRAPIDDVLVGVMRHLSLPVPPFERSESFYLRHQAGPAASVASDAEGLGSPWSMIWALHLADHSGAPCGYIEKLVVMILGEGDSGAAAEDEVVVAETVTLSRQPFKLERSTTIEGSAAAEVRLAITVHFDKVPTGRSTFFQPDPIDAQYTIRGSGGVMSEPTELGVSLCPPAPRPA